MRSKKIASLMLAFMLGLGLGLTIKSVQASADCEIAKDARIIVEGPTMEQGHTKIVVSKMNESMLIIEEGNCTEYRFTGDYKIYLGSMLALITSSSSPRGPR